MKPVGCAKWGGQWETDCKRKRKRNLYTNKIKGSMRNTTSKHTKKRTENNLAMELKTEFSE